MARARQCSQSPEGWGLQEGQGEARGELEVASELKPERLQNLTADWKLQGAWRVDGGFLLKESDCEGQMVWANLGDTSEEPLDFWVGDAADTWNSGEA